MKDRTVYLEIVVFLLVAIFCSAYVAKVVGGPDPLSGSYRVTMEMPNAVGLVTSSEVAYRGVTMGKVVSITVAPDRNSVDVGLELRRNVDVPVDSVATISQDTAAPVLKVSLESTKDAGPYLDDGSVITNTKVPPSLSTVISNFNGVADTFKPEDLLTVTRELATGLQGTGPDIANAAKNFAILSNTVAASDPALVNLLGNADGLFAPGADGSAPLPEIAASLRQLSAQVQDNDPALNTILDQTPSILSDRVSPFLRNNQQSVTLLLANGVVASQIVADRLPALNATLVALPDGLNKLSSIPGADGRARLDLVTTAGPVCFYNTPRRQVGDLSPQPLNPDQYCTDNSSQLQQRGSQYAPRPAGDTTPAGGATTGAAAATSGATSVGVTSYDPSTGITAAADGSTTRMGLSGGQQAILGKNSYAALLLQGTQ